MTIQGLFRTKGTNPESGKPNVVAMMFDEYYGVSVNGGALGPGVHLTFGEMQPFRPSQWSKLTNQEYTALCEED